jgi:hypothetical protein
LSAAGSAAQRTYTDEDNSDAFIRPAEADRVKPRLRMVAGGAPVIGPVVEEADFTVSVRASAPNGEDLDDHWPEDLPGDSLGSASEIEARLEARVDGVGSKAPFMAVIGSGDGEPNAKEKEAETNHGLKSRETMGLRENRESHHPGPKELKKSVPPKKQSAIQGKSRRPGLKKLNKKQISLDWPPTPRGCEWRRSDAGLNLWRCWTEWDDDKGKRIKKSRYAGHLSDDAWRTMKEYDHETFISIVGERLRRHSGR